ncbi:hypothetical protein [Parapedobacter sp.]
MDSKLYPMHLVPQEAEILEGFVWKPGDRPTSKEDLLTRRRPPADAALAVPSDSTTQGRQPAAEGQSPEAARPVGSDSARMERPLQPPHSVKDTVRTDSLSTDSSTTDRLGGESPPADSAGVDLSANIDLPRPYQHRKAAQRQIILTAFCATNRVVADRARRRTPTAA